MPKEETEDLSLLKRATMRFLRDAEGVTDEKRLQKIAAKAVREEQSGKLSPSQVNEIAAKVLLSSAGLELSAIEALNHYRGLQPRAWVKSQLLRNGWSEATAERLLRDHFDVERPSHRSGGRSRSGNPMLSSFHEKDREGFEKILVKASGCSAAVAKKIAHAYPFGTGLAQATPATLRGLGATTAQAQRIRSAFDLCQEVSRHLTLWRSILTVPDDVVAYLRAELGGRQEEHFVAIYLNKRLKVIDTLVVAKGSLDSVEVHPREVFRNAVRLGAKSIILAHNHPSGDAGPSDADIVLTNRLVDVGDALGIQILDHIVMAGYGSDASWNSIAALGRSKIRVVA